MLDDVLNRIFFNQTMVFLLVTGILVLVAEGGYRMGIFHRRRNSETDNQGSAQGAVLGLMGLLLGFSFAMAVGRYDTRRDLLLEEANSIGTTWLRADFLPTAHSQPVKDLLVRYATSRVEAGRATDDRKEIITRFCGEAGRIHRDLWRHASSAAAEQPSPMTASFITTLNETIDLHSKRLAAARNHVPGVVWLLLLVVSGCGAWANGHISGCSGHRSTFSQIVFPILIGVVITLISDIDRPQKGMIGVNQKPIEELLQSIQAPQP